MYMHAFCRCVSLLHLSWLLSSGKRIEWAMSWDHMRNYCLKSSCAPLLRPCCICGSIRIQHIRISCTLNTTNSPHVDYWMYKSKYVIPIVWFVLHAQTSTQREMLLIKRRSVSYYNVKRSWLELIGYKRSNPNDRPVFRPHKFHVVADIHGYPVGLGMTTGVLNQGAQRTRIY